MEEIVEDYRNEMDHSENVVKWSEPLFDIKAGKHRFIEFLIQCDRYSGKYDEHVSGIVQELADVALPKESLITWLNIPSVGDMKACSVISVKIPCSSLCDTQHDGKFWLSVITKILKQLGINPRTMSDKDFRNIFSLVFGREMGDLSLTAPDPYEMSKEPLLKRTGDDGVIDLDERSFRILSAKRFPHSASIESSSYLDAKNDEALMTIHIWQLWFKDIKGRSERKSALERISFVSPEAQKYTPILKPRSVMNIDSSIEPKIFVSRSIWLISKEPFKKDFLDNLITSWDKAGSEESKYHWVEENYIMLPEFIRLMPLWDLPGDETGSQAQTAISNGFRAKSVTRQQAAALLSI